MRMQRVAIAVAIALGASLSAHAQDSSMFRFSGFGTLGAVATDTDQAEYATSVLQPGGAKKSADFGVDSLIAGQVDARFLPSLSATVQAVANRTADDDYKPHIEWALVRWSILPDLSVRGGIMAVPVFTLSDTRLVGFTYPWMRPPTAVYSQAPFTNFTGADLIYRFDAGPASVSLQPYVGRARPEVPITEGGHVKAELDNLMGVNVGAEMKGWTVRGGYFKTDFTYRATTVSQVFAGLRQVGALVPGATQLANELDTIDKSISFTTAGVGYEGGNVFAQAEWARRKADLFLADTTSWYATGGYRFGNFMPHLTISRVKVDSATSQSVIPAVGPFAALAAGVNQLLSSQNVAQKAVALGARWQFHKNVDLKVQWDRIDLPNGALGNFQRALPGFAGSKVDVYSAGVDFVF